MIQTETLQHLKLTKQQMQQAMEMLGRAFHHQSSYVEHDPFTQVKNK